MRQAPAIRRLEDRVRLFAHKNRLWTHGSHLLLAVSGGADSLCMLHLLALIGPGEGLLLTVAHLHHGMRPEGDADLEFVAAQAEALGLPFVSRRSDVPALAEHWGVGLEEAGRRARREFLDQAAVECGASVVATAHTRSDQVETVLLHLFRGSGLHGLAGITPRGFGNRIRPLLSLTREETVAACEALELQPRHDPANDDLSFLRNRIRHQVLPLLREQINPAVEDAICRMAALAPGWIALVEEAGARLLKAARIDDPPAQPHSCSQVALYLRHPLRSASAAARSEALRQALIHVRGTELNVTSVDIQRIIDILESGGVTPLWGGWAAQASGPYLRILRVDGLAKESPRPGSAIPLDVPGVVHLSRGRCITAAPGVPPEPIHPQNRSHSVWIRSQSFLAVRFPEPGDRIRPLRRGGSRKLKDLFQENQIPVWERTEWPLVAGPNGILWAPGLALDERAATLGPQPGAILLSYRNAGCSD